MSKNIKNNLHDLDTFIELSQIERLCDDDLEKLNNMLPWASFVTDSRGRIFGKQFSKNKRSEPQPIPDSRIVNLHARYNLSDKHVLEIGCFEGNHSIALAALAKKVTCLDSRIEHVVKTIVRTAMAGYHPDVHCVDVEEGLEGISLDCDICHHVGVLYHLENPVQHLKELSNRINSVLMIDSHVAPEDKRLVFDSETGVRYWRFEEGGRTNPFAGMKSYAKWLHVDDLVKTLRLCGFSKIEVAEKRAERNGPRILLFAER